MQILQIDNANIKALFRRGQAEIGLKNYDEALHDLLRVHNMSPSTKVILDEYNRAKKFWMEYNVHQKKVYKNLFK